MSDFIVKVCISALEYFSFFSVYEYKVTNVMYKVHFSKKSKLYLEVSNSSSGLSSSKVRIYVRYWQLVHK
jgi:hypothetical protein